MNEAILTGESIPVNKKPLELGEKPFQKVHSEYAMLYTGTTCLKSHGKVNT